MGILSGIKKAVTYLPNKQKENSLKKKLDERPPIVAVVKTDFPENYREYWESDGYTTEMINGRVVVWNRHLSKQDIAAIKEKHLGKTI